MGRRVASSRLVGAAALSLGLAGCVSFLPLPVSPFQVMTKDFPPEVVGPGGAQRDYTIKGDTFAYPTVGFSVNRPDSANWEFVPGNSSVTIQVRDGITSTEPRPGMVVQLVSLPSGFDVEGSKVSDLVNFQKANASVTISPRVIDGSYGDAWTISASNPQTNTALTTLRIYVTLPTVLVIVQASGDPSTVQQLGPYFAQMMNSIKLPTLPAGTAPLPVPVSPLVAGKIKGDVLTDPVTGVTLTRADANWSFGPGQLAPGMSDVVPAVRRLGVAAGVNAQPEMTMTTAASPDAATLPKLIYNQLALFKQAKVAVTVAKRTVNGNQGQQLTYDLPDALGTLETVRKVFFQNSKALVILEAHAVKTDFAKVSADFDKMIDGVTLPAGNAVAVPDVTASGVVVNCPAGATTPPPGSLPTASGAASPAVPGICATGAAAPVTSSAPAGPASPASGAATASGG